MYRRPSTLKSLLAICLFSLAAAPVLGLPSSTDSPPAGGVYTGGGGTAYLKPTEYRKALKLLEKNDYKGAIPLLLKALEKSPKDPDILNELGYAYRQTGDYESGLKYYNEALAIDPDHKEAREYLGELYLKQHKLTEAQAQLTELARLCPDGCEARAELEKAIAAYQKAQ